MIANHRFLLIIWTGEKITNPIILEHRRLPKIGKQLVSRFIYPDLATTMVYFVPFCVILFFHTQNRLLRANLNNTKGREWLEERFLRGFGGILQTFEEKHEIWGSRINFIEFQILREKGRNRGAD